MERAVFDRMAEMDGAHWWYVARRSILNDIILREVAPPGSARILEIGCGTGHNLDMLGAFGKVDALEIDDAAASLAAKRLGRPVPPGALPALDGVPDGGYDLVALLDVLEHVADDRAALAGVARVMTPNGKLLLTVPANPWMWSAHDAAHHHHRRYSKGALLRVFDAAGMRVDFVSHFNSLLFPIAAAARVAGNLAGKTESDDRMPSPAVNRVLTGIFGLERHMVGRVPMPFGVSIVAVASRR
jgi:SAM-dependent methyltransferase